MQAAKGAAGEAAKRAANPIEDAAACRSVRPYLANGGAQESGTSHIERRLHAGYQGFDPGFQA
jgi:hypothetical protein